jgi:hypothetical protein
MTLIKKCDVKNYRSSRLRKASRPFRPANELGPTQLLENERSKTDANAPGFLADFVLEHSMRKEPSISSIVSVKVDDKDAPSTGTELPL